MMLRHESLTWQAVAPEHGGLVGAGPAGTPAAAPVAVPHLLQPPAAGTCTFIRVQWHRGDAAVITSNSAATS